MSAVPPKCGIVTPSCEVVALNVSTVPVLPPECMKCALQETVAVVKEAIYVPNAPLKEQTATESEIRLSCQVVVEHVILAPVTPVTDASRSSGHYSLCPADSHAFNHNHQGR